MASKGQNSNLKELQLKAKKAFEDLRENSGLCSRDVEELINELQTYHAELEVQAEELIEKQQELSESREKYFELYDLAPVGYVTLNKQLMITEANITFSRLIGINKDKLKNQEFVHYVAPDYRDVFHSHCSELLNSGEGQSCELKFRGVDGNEFWVNMESTVDKNGAGNITGIRATLIDISEQKKRNEVEHLLTSIMDKSPDAVTLQDFSGKIISWNRGAEELYGYTSKEALKMKIDKIVPEDKRTELNNLRVVLQAKGKIDTLETKRLTKDGDIIDVWLSISVYNTPLGRPAGFLTIERDITWRKKQDIERKRLLTQLAEQRRLMRAVLDQTPVGIIIANQTGKVILQNEMLDKIFGVRVPDAERFSEYGKVRKIHHENGPLYTPEDFPLYRTIKHGEVIIGEVAPFQRADGNYGTLEMHAAPVHNEANDIIAGVVIVQDITKDIEYENDLRESRDFAENILASIRDGILILDVDLNVVRCNLPYSKLFDVHVKDILEKSIFEIQNGIWNYSKIRRQINSLAEDLKPFNDLEIEMEFPRIGKRVIVINGRPVISVDRGADMILISFRDISEYRTAKHEIERLNSALMQHNVSLQEANKELEAFTYSVSHDLRGPLRAIDGFSRILLEEYNEKLDDKGQHYLDRIISGANSMGALIDDLLRLSRISRAILNEEAISLSSKAEKIAKELRNLDPDRNVTFKIEKNILAEGDRKLIYQALENLLSNAWKYSAENDKTIIEFGSLQKDAQTVYYVRDNGAGFDMEYVNKLFQPFQRLHTSTEYSGTGIGLSIVERIIKRHKGEIWAEGKEGEGATFYFTLQSGERDEDHAAKHLTG